MVITTRSARQAPYIFTAPRADPAPIDRNSDTARVVHAFSGRELNAPSSDSRSPVLKTKNSLDEYAGAEDDVSTDDEDDDVDLPSAHAAIVAMAAQRAIEEERRIADLRETQIRTQEAEAGPTYEDDKRKAERLVLKDDDVKRAEEVLKAELQKDEWYPEWTIADHSTTFERDLAIWLHENRFFIPNSFVSSFNEEEYQIVLERGIT
jgi:hypothetical protein